MTLFGALVYLNAFIATVNILTVVEIVFQLVGPNINHSQQEDTSNKYSLCKECNCSRDVRIVGGEMIPISTFPYVAAILIKSDIEEEYDFHCASVIVTVAYALTAAHCVEIMKVNTITVRKVRSGSSFWSTGGALHDIVTMISHENFAENFGENDIGIISVTPPFDPAQTIKVAGPKFVLKDNSSISVTGWGETNATKTRDFITTNQLYCVVVAVINTDECVKMINTYYEVEEPPYYKVYHTEFCAGTTEGKGTCVYDSGGPAAQQNVLVGVVSQGGPVCSSAGYPGVYANLMNLHDWLVNNTAKFQEQIVFAD